MSSFDRKSRVREYKETPRTAGVYRIRNTATGRSLVGSAVNVPGRMNRHRFQLKAGTHPDGELQADWNALGETAFEFTELDRLEPRDDPSYDANEELRLLEAMWLEKLAASGESLYGPRARDSGSQLMESYDWSQFHVRMYYLAPRARVFHFFSTAVGLESFFIHKASHAAADGTPRKHDEPVRAGDRYHWTYVHDFEHGGQFLQVETNRLVRFTFGPMTVDVHFRDVGEATEVDLHQTNCAVVDPDRAWQHVNCRSCWIYFMTNLRSVLAGGPDLRDHEHPNWNDSVSIGFDPDLGAGSKRGDHDVEPSA